MLENRSQQKMQWKAWKPRFSQNRTFENLKCNTINYEAYISRNYAHVHVKFPRTLKNLPPVHPVKRSIETFLLFFRPCSSNQTLIFVCKKPNQLPRNFRRGRKRVTSRSSKFKIARIIIKLWRYRKSVRGKIHTRRPINITLSINKIYLSRDFLGLPPPHWWY